MKNSFVLFCLFCTVIAGCGTGTEGAPAVSKSEAAKTCNECHGRQSSDWKLSTHYSKNGATCIDCHAPHPGHPNTCNTCHNGQASSDPNHVPLRDTGTSLCLITCHVGTVSGDNISTASGNFSNMPFVNSHSLPTGMTLFRQVGFEFYTSQLKYADPNPFKHSVIGINNFSSTGTSGPCITCHIGQAGEFKRHLPLPVDRNGNLLSTVCANCHAGWMTTDILKSKKDGYEAALAVLAKVLKDRGFSYTETYPNFNNTDWVTSGGFGNAVVPGTGGLTAGMYTMGAAFNFNLLWHDYGAYAHNRIYAKRLIFDSIDWIVNGGGGAMTGSFALPAATGELIFTKSNGTAVNYTAEIRTKAVDYLGTSGLRP